MKKLISFVFSVLLIGGLQAQIIDRQVIASAGSSGELNHVNINWTMGEVAIATLSNGSMVLTEGFHQPNLVSDQTSVELPAENPIVKVYPNPARDAFIVELPSYPEKPLFLSLANSLGQTLINERLTATRTTISLMALPAGIYFLKVSDGTLWLKSIKIIKN